MFVEVWTRFYVSSAFPDLTRAPCGYQVATRLIPSSQSAHRPRFDPITPSLFFLRAWWSLVTEPYPTPSPARVCECMSFPIRSLLRRSSELRAAFAPGHCSLAAALPISTHARAPAALALTMVSKRKANKAALLQQEIADEDKMHVMPVEQAAEQSDSAAAPRRSERQKRRSGLDLYPDVNSTESSTQRPRKKQKEDAMAEVENAIESLKAMDDNFHDAVKRQQAVV